VPFVNEKLSAADAVSMKVAIAVSSAPSTCTLPSVEPPLPPLMITAP